MRVQIVFVHRNDDSKIVLQCGIDRLRFEKVVGTVDFGNVRIGEGIVVRLREERGRTERRCKKRGEAFFYKIDFISIILSKLDIRPITRNEVF